MSKFASIAVGDRATVVHTVTDSDIEKFVELTGDDNKLHVSKEYASKTDFKLPVVHGMIGASFISTLIGTKLPGDGALWFSQSLEFVRPVRVGDTITVQAEVISKNDKAEVIELKTDILNQFKQLVTTGIAKVKIIEQHEAETPADTISEVKQQKVAMVLGASGGIGRVTAEKLAQDGFDVIIHYHSNKSEAKLVEEKVKSHGRKALLVQADLFQEDQIEAMMDKIMRTFSVISGFVNCTTTKIPNIKFSDLEWKHMASHFDINIKASFLLLKKILPVMEKQKYGKIVFLTTQAIETPNTEWLHYITAKASLNGFAKALAIEYASKNININMVSPSLVDTELVADIPKRAKMLIEAKTPLKRLCSAEDIANAIVFLISAKADFMTGETLRVNGGQVMI